MATILMGKNNSDSSLELLVVIKRIADKIGIKNLKARLNELDSSTMSLSDDNVQLGVMDIICETMNVSKSVFKKHKDFKTQEVYWAINYFIVILNKHGKFSADKISEILDLKRKTIYNRIYEFNKLNPENRVDKDYITIYSKIIFEVNARKIFANSKN